VTIRAPLLLVLVTVVAALPQAASARVFEVKVNDTIDILNTRMACKVVKTTHKEINCFLATNRGVLGSTYAIGISEVGAAVVSKVSPKGTSSSTVWTRTKASARANPAGTYYRMVVEDSFVVPIKGGYLGCKIFDVEAGPVKFRGRKVECWRQTPLKPFPRTYGVSLSDTYARSFQFDAKGNRGPTIFVGFQPKR
jgi:hypothetical protein